MARKPKVAAKHVDKGVVATGYRTIPWMVTPGAYLAGRAALDEADALEVEMELTWGRDRLRLLVPTELREKFDRQRYLTSQARWEGELEDVKREAARMVKAWLALDKAAREAGKEILDPAVFEVTLEDGSVAAIVKEPDLANKVAPDGRNIRIYTLEEIGHMIWAFNGVLRAKEEFPGSTVQKNKTRVSDPLESPLGANQTEGIWDTTAPIDGPPKGFDWEQGDEIPW